ncbi:hypothetical protein Misp01_31000 [Microtetraspora sp. NBRC 13810]|nr:hypothetical protein Misp01_31000 [Microtetraspora sp. NBRC 13810]
MADYRLVGRLGHGGQGVVYLGESASGERVAVKVIRDGSVAGDAGFAREIDLTRRVQAFCTAQVLATGESGGRPYIVSEYVEGPSLASVLRERGVLRGAELRRLAIGTLTALAAIHQAGVVHRDFKPGNVLLSKDGPRVIDFGIARAQDGAEPGGDDLVGTPPFMAPEQFTGGEAGAPADLFAWASTMVCASSGAPPFGRGDPAGVIGRILLAEPLLGDGLDDGAGDESLRDLVVACLAKDPAARPPATRALLTLLGHPVPPRRLLPAGRESAAPPPSPPPGPPPVRRRYGRARVPLTVAGVAVLLAGGAAVYAGTAERSGPVARQTVAAVVQQRPMAARSTTTVRIPGTEITLHENPADGLWVSAYYDRRTEGGGDPSYVRDRSSGRFAFFGSFQEPVVSPGGVYVASLSYTRLTRTDHDTVRITEPAARRDVELVTVTKPATTFGARWSPDGRLLLLTVYVRSANDSASRGFVIVDPATGTVRTVPAADGDPTEYVWAPDGSGVLHQTADGGVRLHDLDGRVLREFRDVGELKTVNGVTTARGALFTTTCPGGSRDVCLWDVATGRRNATVPLAWNTTFHGWMDDRHLLATVREGEDAEMVLLGLDGRAVRTLATGPARELDKVPLWFTRR